MLIKKSIATTIKYTIITAIFGDYDILHEPEIVDTNCTYICFTDNINRLKKLLPENTAWTIKEIQDPEVLKIDNPRSKVYYIRYHLFKYCTTYYCIWLDSAYLIRKSLFPFVKPLINDKYEIGTMVYYNEFDTVYKNSNLWKDIDNPAIANCLDIIFKFLKNNNYPFEYRGMFVASMRVCKNTNVNQMICNDTYNLLISLHKDFYLDEFVYSYILNTKYNNLKIFPINNYINHSDYLMAFNHNSNEFRYGKYKYPTIYNNIKRRDYMFNKEIENIKV